MRQEKIIAPALIIFVFLVDNKSGCCIFVFMADEAAERENKMFNVSTKPNFKLGSQGENGEHMRGTSGWPFSIYIEANEIGQGDKVLCDGIQNMDDAERLLALCNGEINPPVKSHMQLFSGRFG